MIKQNALPLVSLKSMNIVHFEEITLVNILFEQLDKELDFETLCESFQMLLEQMQELWIFQWPIMFQRLQLFRNPCFKHKSYTICVRPCDKKN